MSQVPFYTREIDCDELLLHEQSSILISFCFQVTSRSRPCRIFGPTPFDFVFLAGGFIQGGGGADTSAAFPLVGALAPGVASRVGVGIIPAAP